MSNTRGVCPGLQPATASAIDARVAFHVANDRLETDRDTPDTVPEAVLPVCSL